jgi:hypothetical protein
MQVTLQTLRNEDEPHRIAAFQNKHFQRAQYKTWILVHYAKQERLSIIIGKNEDDFKMVKIWNFWYF